MTNAEFRMLIAIAGQGQCTTSELEAILGVGKSSVHKYLVRLRGAGFIEGEKDMSPVAHRPRYYFSLTEDGLKAMKEMRLAQIQEGEAIDQLLGLSRSNVG